MGIILSKCPNCNNYPDLVDAHVGITYEVRCFKCGLRGPESNSRRDVVLGWQEMLHSKFPIKENGDFESPSSL